MTSFQLVYICIDPVPATLITHGCLLFIIKSSGYISISLNQNSDKFCLVKHITKQNLSDQSKQDVHTKVIEERKFKTLKYVRQTTK